MSNRLKLFVFAVPLALAVAVAPALAGKGGNGGGNSAPSSGSSSIAIATIHGGLVASSTLTQARKLGDTLTFATTVASLAGNAYPMVVLSCYQDVNHDGTVDTSITGPDIVFSDLDQPSAQFTLGGWSPWTLNG